MDGAGYVTFGSFNNMSKVNERAVACWAKVMVQVPKSRLVLKGQGLDDAGFHNQILKKFAARDINADRLDLIGYQQSKSSHL